MTKRAPWYVYIPLLIWIVISLFPAYWMTVSSFKNDTQIYQMPPIWWVTPNLDAYIKAFENTELVNYVMNSLKVALITTALSVILGAPAAWGLSKFRYPGGRFWFYLVIGTRLIPPIALLTPFFEFFLDMNLINNISALVVPYLFFNMPLAIWIMKNHFDGLPKEITDAARVDGASYPQMFFRVALPINVPGIVLAAILVFLFSWNEFMFALVLTQSEGMTLPVGITSFFADGFVIWNQLSAAVVVSLIPAIVFVILFQRYIIRGVAEGAVKG